ncbi:MAG: DNA polymerase III subunit delta [Odoribacteraceae bacterium]|jgi:DNA polymerase-3 subunit delta|nr:DNA polymerase III subunit delta [Odoribacteraceae bacterium]
MKHEEIIAEIRAGHFTPVYFLSGEEPFFIDDIADEIEKRALSGEEKVWSQVILYGNEVNMSRVVDESRQFPMLSPRRVVIVREAQHIADKDFEKILPYLARPKDTTLLLFLYKGKKPDKRRDVFKKLAASPACVYFDSVKLYDNEVPGWIEKYCKSRDRKISPAAARLLADSLGTDLSRIANALDKLVILLPRDKKIEETLVEEHVGVSKEFGSFELVSAIVRQDHLKVNRVINYLDANANKKNNEPTSVIAALFFYFRNLLTYHYHHRAAASPVEMARVLGVSPYFMKEYADGAARYGAVKCARVIAWLREYDMKAKGSAGVAIPPGELLRELVFKIMH